MLSRPALPAAGLFLLAILAGVAAAYDIRYRRIPNWLVLTGILVGLLWNLSAVGLLGLCVGFALYFPLYLLRARGAGDVKLLAAAGAIAGPANCLWIFLLTAVLGGVIALALIAVRGRMRQTLFNVAWILRDLLQLRAPYKSSAELDVTTPGALRLPHAAIMAVGTLAFIVMARGK